MKGFFFLPALSFYSVFNSERSFRGQTARVLIYKTMPSACDSLVDDIEDMVSSSQPASLQRLSTRQSVVPRVRKRKNLTASEELRADSLCVLNT
ncbi:hypothetical protein QTP70_025628 [Hemibagrus guttatus]|uniref:Uncharacterized protein n=1 Tax=Hemibagrus guttatus TaxID=175788 RepID=A0AAE0VEH2_9TELE|nr:hypothetical protein QTP70_025628 [Hemibagrus guttatus]